MRRQASEQLLLPALQCIMSEARKVQCWMWMISPTAMTPQQNCTRYADNMRLRKLRPGRISSLTIASWLLACGAPNASPHSVVHETPEQLASVVSDGLKVFRGPVFTLSIPREAIVQRRDDSTWTISAPRQLIRAAIGLADTTRFENDIPLYDLGVRLRRNPTGRSVTAWGDSIRRLESMRTGWDSTTGRPVIAAGQTAYLREPYCGDCGHYIYAFARDSQVVELSFTLSTNEPLGARKRGVYALLLSTFRWVPYR